MFWNQIIGKKKEVLTKEWLMEKGFILINQNWQCCHGELDIIASCFDQLHFIVVAIKAYGKWEASIQCLTRRRMQSCIEAAQKYLERHHEWREATFSLLTISVSKEKLTEFIFLKEVMKA